MPRQIDSSGSESSDNENMVVPIKKATGRGSAGRRTRKAATPTPSPEREVRSEGEQYENEDGSEEDDEEDEDEEYVVEAIRDHRYQGKQLLLLVKWKGYDKLSDQTWEPEENCAGAKEAVEDYFNSVGGRPQYAGKKRGRPSTGGASSTPASATKSTKRARTSLAASSRAESQDSLETGKKWSPPTKDSWEDDVAAIDTIEKGEDGDLICFVQWANGRKSQHKIDLIYKKCPQRMLAFYEQHLVFKETSVL